MLSFWRVKTKKRTGKKKASCRTKSNVRACHESPSSSVAYSRQPPSFPSFFFSTSALDLFSSVGRALDCRAGSPGLHSRGQTNTQGLRTTEKNQGTVQYHKWSPTANDPETVNDPQNGPQMILDRKWSLKSTANDPERKIGMTWTQVIGPSCRFYYYYSKSD